MKLKAAFFLILAIAIFLRFWKLGSFPPGFTWDEAAIGYNAFGILTVHRDEFLNRVPLSFRSFGDYKSPLLIYLVAVSELFLGVTEVAVRFPVAVSGVFLVVGSYYLMRELIRTKLLPITEKHSELATLVVMALVAVSPLAWHYSVIGFESMLATALACWGAVFFLKGLDRSRNFVVSAACYTLSLYAYHSAKVVVPLTILAFLFLLRNEISKTGRAIGLFFLVCLILGAPLLYGSLFGNANARFIGSTIILDANQKVRPLSTLAPLLVDHFAAHINPAYLFAGAETNFRQSNMRDGILSPVEGVLILSVLVMLLKDKKYRKVSLLLLFLAISILPATLGNDVPHSNRALMGLPWFQILAGVGFVGLWQWAQTRKMTKTLLDMLIITLAFGALWHHENDLKTYATSTALADMQYGYKEAIAYTRSKESEVNKVVFTNHYGQAYIFLLFYKQLNPIEYRGGALANYTISDHPYKDAAGIPNTLLVGIPSDFPEQIQSTTRIFYPDGQTAFMIVKQ